MLRRRCVAIVQIVGEACSATRATFRLGAQNSFSHDSRSPDLPVKNQGAGRSARASRLRHAASSLRRYRPNRRRSVQRDASDLSAWRPKFILARLPISRSPCEKSGSREVCEGEQVAPCCVVAASLSSKSSTKRPARRERPFG